MLIAILAGFIVGILSLVAGALFRGRAAGLIVLLPLALFSYFLSLLPKVMQAGSLLFQNEWIPSLGIRLDFNLDGLSLLFCLLITGIGSLVYWYAVQYMKGHAQLDRFFCYLSIFMGSMLGLVLCDNVLALFVFWELTSISSFFLIGFESQNADSRKSALLALGITGGGGFLLMAGFILMGSISGDFSIKHMIAEAEVLKEHGLYWLVLVFVFAGAFTKSAQFPFHFWLPGAMKAPTPVSAYLHSATMVKAGIYLLARFTPVLGSHPAWNQTLLITGGLTMVYAAIHALFRTDLKSILAYSTIAALGIIVFLLGVGTSAALTAVTVFILVHALYKAGLFLVTGIVDHTTGLRNVVVLAGLRKKMPALAVAGLLVALSSAGVPFTLGFIGKDLIYESSLSSGNWALVITAVAVLTNVLLLYAGFVVGIKPFMGRLPADFSKLPSPSAWLWWPPLILGLAGLFFGCFPGVLNSTLVQPVLQSMGASAGVAPLKIWHGFNTVLLLSAITLAAGITLFLLLKPNEKSILFVNRFQHASPEQLLAGSVQQFRLFAAWVTGNLQSGYLRIYILIITIFLTTLLSFKLFTGVRIYIDSSKLHSISIYEAVITVVTLAAIMKTLFTTSRLVAVSCMGVVGYCICLLFVFYSAPDLAMTQFSIDTLTVVLFVLVLFRLPAFTQMSTTPVKIRDAVVSLSFGGLLSLIALEVLNESVTKTTSSFYASNAYLIGKGKNVVNVIIVDFRGFDTLVEIMVLTIAAIGVYSMLKLKVAAGAKE